MSYMTQKDLTNTTIDSQRSCEIHDRVHRVFETIHNAEQRYGRTQGAVTLVAATKTRDIGEILAAIDAGVRAIAENRPQEVMAKAQLLAQEAAAHGWNIGPSSHNHETPTISTNNMFLVPANSENISCKTLYHASNSTTMPYIPLSLIGQLQSNKISKMIPLVDAITSVTSIEQAEKISRRALAIGTCMNIMLEVNESGESAKSGCLREAAVDIALRIANLDGVRLRGLMTMGALGARERDVRASFAHLRGIREKILASGQRTATDCVELSMGMSNDMQYGIAEGATIVRIGSAIFGPRAFV